MESVNDIPLLKQLRQADGELLRAKLKPKSFSKGEPIIVPGQTQHELYFVQKGVQMAHIDSVDHVHVIAFTYPPNLCAIPESFSFQTPANYSLTCLVDSNVLYLTFDELQVIFDKSQAIERLFRQLTETILAGLITRHIELLTLSMAERYQTFCRRSPHLLQLVPHKYSASYLGIDPTNFSKLFNQVRI